MKEKKVNYIRREVCRTSGSPQSIGIKAATPHCTLMSFKCPNPIPGLSISKHGIRICTTSQTPISAPFHKRKSLHRKEHLYIFTSVLVHHNFIAYPCKYKIYKRIGGEFERVFNNLIKSTQSISLFWDKKKKTNFFFLNRVKATSQNNPINNNYTFPY